ncbi:hypothetical protein GFL28_24785 [Rhizobium leguminosarum bv. viciae]|nr:hypothetical protein [Rhizobium leguminosarum bv. viciae]
MTRSGKSSATIRRRKWNGAISSGCWTYSSTATRWTAGALEQDHSRPNRPKACRAKVCSGFAITTCVKTKT